MTKQKLYAFFQKLYLGEYCTPRPNFFYRQNGKVQASKCVVNHSIVTTHKKLWPFKMWETSADHPVHKVPFMFVEHFLEKIKKIIRGTLMSFLPSPKPNSKYVLASLPMY